MRGRGWPSAAISTKVSMIDESGAQPRYRSIKLFVYRPWGTPSIGIAESRELLEHTGALVIERGHQCVDFPRHRREDRTTDSL